MKNRLENGRNQDVLRKRFWFRVIVLILSTAGSVMYGFFNTYCPEFWGVILGLSGSALVWSVVELMDFFVETYHWFISERATNFL